MVRAANQGGQKHSPEGSIESLFIDKTRALGSHRSKDGRRGLIQGNATPPDGSSGSLRIAHSGKRETNGEPGQCRCNVCCVSQPSAQLSRSHRLVSSGVHCSCEAALSRPRTPRVPGGVAKTPLFLFVVPSRLRLSNSSNITAANYFSGYPWHGGGA